MQSHHRAKEVSLGRLLSCSGEIAGGSKDAFRRDLFLFSGLGCRILNPDGGVLIWGFRRGRVEGRELFLGLVRESRVQQQR